MSTYLQYNNHMILHPTDRSKYFYGIVEDPPEPPGPTSDEVTIGDQTWMTKNLAIDDGLGGIYTETVNYGYGYITEYYYTQEAAVRLANSVDGWHLPSKSEFETLGSYVGGTSIAGTKLKSTYGWEDKPGDDEFGFTALPAGQWASWGTSDPTQGSVNFIGEDAIFWTSTTGKINNAYYTSFTYMSDKMLFATHYVNVLGYSVRLIKDS